MTQKLNLSTVFLCMAVATLGLAIFAYLGFYNRSGPTTGAITMTSSTRESSNRSARISMERIHIEGTHRIAILLPSYPASYIYLVYLARKSLQRWPPFCGWSLLFGLDTTWIGSSHLPPLRSSYWLRPYCFFTHWICLRTDSRSCIGVQGSCPTVGQYLPGYIFLDWSPVNW